MSFSWKTLKKIFDYYLEFIKKITTLIGCFFIYFIGIFLGYVFYKFSKKEKINSWQKYSDKSPLEVMY